jgi:hypothetical protein
MHAAIPSDWGISLDYQEDMNRRTLHSMRFEKGGGQHISILGSNYHYQALPGEWEPQSYEFRLNGANHDADRHVFRTRVSDAGIEVLDSETGVGVQWLTPIRPAVQERKASLSGDGIAWEWIVGPKRLKLEGVVARPLGVRTHEFPYRPLGDSQDFQIVDGAAVAPGLVVHAPMIIGADGSLYSTSGWTMLPGPRLGFTFNDSILPSEAYPYIIDPTTTPLQPGSGGFDNRIYDAIPALNLGDSAEHTSGDPTNGGPEIIRALHKFDVSSIDSGDIVSDSTLSLHENDAGDTAGVGSWAMNQHRLLRDWVETQSTWNIYSTGNNWGTAGASNSTDRSATISAAVTLDGTSGGAFVDWNAAQLTTDVQNFLNGAVSNYGWIMVAPTAELQSGGNSYNAFRSSDYGTAGERPKLTVVHADPPPPVLSGDMFLVFP